MKHKTIVSLIFCILVTSALIGCTDNRKPSAPIKNGHALTWSDEFDGVALDAGKWSYQTGTRDYYNGEYGPQYWGNGELEYYTEGDNLKLENGELVITAKREQRGDRPYTSGRIVSRDKFSQTYGYFEARIKMPAVGGLWPAFWLLPQIQNNPYETWASNGEIDIMEARGREPYKVDTTLHYGGKYPDNTYSHNSATLAEPISEWHVYALDWRAEYIAWFIDDEEVYRLTNDKYYSAAAPDNPSAPFDVPFYVLLNLAVGGQYDGYFEPDASFTQAEMRVDYVRVYE